MKVFISLLILTAAGITWGQDYSYLDNRQGTSMEPILAAAKPLIKEVENKDFEIVRMEFDIVKTKKTTYRNLYKGWTYGIAAFGDYRIKDIDLALYMEKNGRWVKIEEDAEDDDVATVSIKPRTDGKYKIEISVYEFNKGYGVGHYGLLIFHE